MIKDYLYTLQLVIDNDQQYFRRMLALCKEILGRKHGDRRRMVRELARRMRSNVFRRPMYQVEHLGGLALSPEEWDSLLSHYEEKLKDGALP